MAKQNITTVLFDLGGVLIELGSLSEMMQTSPLDDDAIWENWIHNPAVKRFESGNCSAEEFAQRMIDELALELDINAFLEHFRAWPKGPYDDALQLVTRLKSQFQLVCLSNTNITHYESFLRHQPILQVFDSLFLSHETGVIKPEVDAFNQVLTRLDLKPSEIMFFDDNSANVDAARALGIRSEQVSGVDELMTALINSELLTLAP